MILFGVRLLVIKLQEKTYTLLTGIVSRRVNSLKSLQIIIRACARHIVCRKLVESTGRCYLITYQILFFLHNKIKQILIARKIQQTDYISMI